MRLVTTIAMVLISLNASADYFKGGLGFNMGGEVTDETPGSTTGSIDLDNTFMTPLLFAYGFEMVGDVHGELELAYRQHEYDLTGATSEPTLLTGAFNVVGNAPMGGVTLTGGAGLFFGQFDADSSSGSGTGFGLQIFGGADFAINESVTLGGEFRYMTTVADVGLDNNVDVSYNSMALLFNVKFGM